VSFRQLFLSPAQWQDPLTFRPERFDPEDPMFLTPDGKRRAFGSFMPFYPGPRSCVATLFAQREGMLMLATLVHLFDFSIPKDKCESEGVWLSVKASAANITD